MKTRKTTTPLEELNCTRNLQLEDLAGNLNKIYGIAGGIKLMLSMRSRCTTAWLRIAQHGLESCLRSGVGQNLFSGRLASITIQYSTVQRSLAMHEMPARDKKHEKQLQLSK
ncbi:hypothetical protein SDJN02_07948, partial [Cucurbita argyrosperma subsp. argyrosperma]